MIDSEDDARAAARSVLRYVDSPRGSDNCVLIDVVDVGDAWRIYFGRTSARSFRAVHVSTVPLLMDKATATVTVEDPPTDPKKPSALDSLKIMLRDEVGPELRTLGFSGSGRVFRLRIDTHYATLGFQGSTYSNRAIARFFLNVSVVSKPVWDAAVAAEGGPRRPGAATCVGPQPGFYTRAEAINPADIPAMWHILQGRSTAPTARHLLRVIKHDILPAMNEAVSTLPPN